MKSSNCYKAIFKCSTDYERLTVGNYLGPKCDRNVLSMFVENIPVPLRIYSELISAFFYEIRLYIEEMTPLTLEMSFPILVVILLS